MQLFRQRYRLIYTVEFVTRKSESAWMYVISVSPMIYAIIHADAALADTAGHTALCKIVHLFRHGSHTKENSNDLDLTVIHKCHNSQRVQRGWVCRREARVCFHKAFNDQVIVFNCIQML